MDVGLAGEGAAAAAVADGVVGGGGRLLRPDADE